MTDLPKPAFSTEEEQLAAGAALASAKDTTKENVENAVPLGEVVWDTGLAHVRVLKKEDELLYHVFRGQDVPDKFWGEGEFGLCLLSAAESVWHLDRPKVEFMNESCRPEVYEDDPRFPSKFPPHYYTAYLVAIPGMERRLFLPKERLTKMCQFLEEELKESIAGWSNGG